MNMKKIRKFLPRIALVLVLVVILTASLTSCGGQAIEIKDAKYWAQNEANLTASTDFLDVLLSYIGTFLNWITSIMPANSYILTLFVFAIMLEILMLPFSIKQQKNSIKQARLRPKEMAIRKRYAGRNDQATMQKVNQEIQELYRSENFNPMSGCLQLFLQLPIIIILYRLVVNPIQYVCGSSQGLWQVATSYINSNADKLGGKIEATTNSIEVYSRIKEYGYEAFAGIQNYCKNGKDVYEAIKNIDATPANFNIGELNFALTPGFDFSTINGLLLLIPVLTFVVYFASMKINRKLSFQPTQSVDARQQACSNNMMDFTMPLMSVWMTFLVPAIVGIYWIFKSIIGVVKQFIMSRVMPLPTFTEEDYKAAEKELYGKNPPKKITKSEKAGTVRSLHHIDDEDYDEKGNYCPKVVETEAVETVTEEKVADNDMTKGASLKDESDKSTKKKKKKD